MKRIWTDRWAIALSILALAILRFLYGRYWWTVNLDTNKAAVAPAIVDAVIDADEWDTDDDWDANANVPWYTYLQENDYTDTKALADFGSDDIITRATSTPFLARYWVVSDLEEKSTETECSFPDIVNKSEPLQATIATACGFDLLRWSNGNFIPDRVMTKDELLTVLVRTKTGFLSEDATPWYKNYFNWAITNGLVTEWTSIEDFSGNVTKADLWQWLYRLSLLD